LLPLPYLPVLFGSSAKAPFHCSRNATRPVVYTSVLTAARFVFFLTLCAFVNSMDARYLVLRT